ncbi:hypothetical protein LC612_41760, partial [Nostoc sp. CHAB 5834]|nr:hypothetical protein [Nostoc sp. CHAB 5834]
MPTIEHEKLVGAISSLKSGLMGFSRDPLGDYSRTQLLMCQAFVVFSHAEIQVYWESISRRILTEAESGWTQRGIVGRVAAALLAFRTPEGVSAQSSMKTANRADFDWIIKEAIKNQKRVIDRNNGIKRS